MRRRRLVFGLLAALVTGASSSWPASAQPIEIDVLPYTRARAMLTQ